MIRVLIAASSALFRAGLESAVRSSPTLELARSVPVERLADDPDDLPADILLAALPQLDEEWIGVISDHSIPAVVLTDTADGALLGSSLRLNVRAVLSTDANPTEIVAAVHAAAAGLVTLHHPIAELLLGDQRPVPAALDEPLSARELEVLSMLAEGLSNKVLAYRLGISEHTVKFHVTSILAKLRAGSRTEAVMNGIRRGLIMI